MLITKTQDFNGSSVYACRAAKRLVIGLLVVVAAASGTRIAGAEDDENVSEARPRRVTPLDYEYWRYLTPQPRDLWGEIREAFWGWNLVAMVATAGTAGGLAFLDNDMQKPWRRGDEILGQDITKIGDVFGNPAVQAGVMGATYTLGQFMGDDKLSETGKAMADTMIFTSLTTIALKGIFHRERPNDSDRLSFPSWHASATFGNATVLTEYYGWKAAIPAYLLSIFVGWSRIEDNKHFVSDVVAGAALGCIWGHAVSSYYKKKERLFSIEPVVMREGIGAQVSKRF
jgi:membrane-associated phospholipid phosphatase